MTRQYKAIEPHSMVWLAHIWNILKFNTQIRMVPQCIILKESASERTYCVRCIEQFSPQIKHKDATPQKEDLQPQRTRQQRELLVCGLSDTITRHQTIIFYAATLQSKAEVDTMISGRSYRQISRLLCYSVGVISWHRFSKPYLSNDNAWAHLSPAKSCSDGCKVTWNLLLNVNWPLT